jgi:hypothetical protein
MKVEVRFKLRSVADINVFTLESTVITTCTNCMNTRKLRISPTECTYVFNVVFRLNRHYLPNQNKHIEIYKGYYILDHLCGLVVRVPGYKSRGPGSISGATRFPEK